MKKVLFVVISSGNAASTRVRVVNLIPELEKYGIVGETVRYPKTLREKWQLIKLCEKFDVIFLQKRTPPRLYAKLLRLVAKKLVYDFDDAIYFKPNDPGEDKNLHRMSRFENILRKADVVIAGNTILAEDAQNYTTQCIVLPSAVETRNIPVKNYEKKSEKFVIGWVGGEINLICLEQLTAVLQALSKRHAIQLRVISRKSVIVPGVETIFIPWNERTQEQEIAEFDVGVMPLFDFPHTRGKCAYKALQYMAAGVPAVVSDVGINSKVVMHGFTGLVAKEFSDFELCLEKLIMDQSLVRMMGEKARTMVEERYSIERIGRELAKILV